MKNKYRSMLPDRLAMVLGLRYRSLAPTPRMDAPLEMPAEVIDLRTGPYQATLRLLES